jgi:FixJ family two-component response regulator
MPVMAQALELQSTVPVLLMSGYTQETIMRAGGSGLGVGLIEKPFTLAKMLEKVSEALGGGQTRS